MRRYIVCTNCTYFTTGSRSMYNNNLYTNFLYVTRFYCAIAVRKVIRCRAGLIYLTLTLSIASAPVQCSYTILGSTRSYPTHPLPLPTYQRGVSYVQLVPIYILLPTVFRIQAFFKSPKKLNKTVVFVKYIIL